MKMLLVVGLCLLLQACRGTDRAAATEPKAVTAAPTAEPTAERRALTDYVRIVHWQPSQEGPAYWVMQTSVRELSNAEGVAIVLLSLAHIGRAEYYDGLTRHLRGAEVVLAEGGGHGADEELPPDALWFRRSQIAYAGLLGLASQADWEASVADSRWVLADMEEEQVLDEVRAGAFRFPEESKPVVERWEALLRGSGSAEELGQARQRAAANVMRSASDQVGEAERTLHERREDIAWRILSDQLSSGRKNIAVVYGAYHVPAIEARLVRERGFRVRGTCWHDSAVFEVQVRGHE